MKYEDTCRSAAISVMKRRIALEIQQSLIKIYLDEKDEKEQNRLLGMIDTIERFKVYKKPKLFDKLEEYKEIIKEINEYPDLYFIEEKSYYEGCCDGIRRLISLNKELRNSTRKVFFISFAASADIEFEFHSAFLINENLTEILNTRILSNLKKIIF